MPAVSGGLLAPHLADAATSAATTFSTAFSCSDGQSRIARDRHRLGPVVARCRHGDCLRRLDPRDVHPPKPHYRTDDGGLAAALIAKPIRMQTKNIDMTGWRKILRGAVQACHAELGLVEGKVEQPDLLQWAVVRYRLLIIVGCNADVACRRKLTAADLARLIGSCARRAQARALNSCRRCAIFWAHPRPAADRLGASLKRGGARRGRRRRRRRHGLGACGEAWDRAPA
jgi:hypothetical protein